MLIYLELIIITPLIIKPSTIKGINYQMEVASAQVKSAILLASLFSKEATTLTEFDVSRNHTETLFAHFNILYQFKVKQSKPYLMQLNIYSLEIFMFQEISHLLHFHSRSPNYAR